MALTRLLRAVSKRRKTAFNECMQPINCQVQANKNQLEFFLQGSIIIQSVEV